MFSVLAQIDQTLTRLAHKYGHWLHRISLGLLFVWFGLLKPLGNETTTSLLAHTVYWGDPDTMVTLLGFWEMAIGLCLLFQPLLRVAMFLLSIRLIGVILTFFLMTDVCFYDVPFTPTPEGQYMIKDLVIFFAALAIVGNLGENRSAVDGRWH